MSGLLNRLLSKEEERTSNLRISKSLHQAQKEDQNCVKLLILGGGDSGKTTLRKQFSRLYGEGFKDEQARLECKEIILTNLLEGMKQTIKAAELFCTFPASHPDAELIRNLKEDYNFVENAENVVNAFRSLYHASEIKLVLEKHRNKFQLQECFIPYFEHIQFYPEWGGPNWVPSVDDCVRSRIRSSGIVEVTFMLQNTKFRVLDAGGQRAERRKWVNAFDGVTALIYVASLTEYNEVLFEDSTKNRLLESLEVFEGLVNSTNFSHVPIILFLNKMDLFEDQYVRRQIPLNASGLFPSAPKEGTPVKEAILWIANEFEKRRTKGKKELFFCHEISAVDSSQVDEVFKHVKQIVLVKTMTEGGMMLS